MPQLRTSRFWSPNIRVALLAISAIALIAAVAGAQAQSASPSRRVAKQAQNAKLGKTILTTLNGRTLYSLSAETNGTFICKTHACLVDWHPLFVPPGVKPTGPVKLGTIVRPDSGRRQVTYRGRPLYTFDDDEKTGDVKGEGFKDVGTWHAATPSQAGPQASPPQPPSSGY
jgi:predicted lipoprotein with Yx(FWY)xxD motif